MHPAILTELNGDVTLQLARFSGSRPVGIVGAFKPGVEYPVWIAKSTANPGSADRLAREFRALRYLEPWAADFGIPRVLFWENTPQQCHMLRSGLPGKSDPGALPIASSRSEIERYFAAPVSWLARFRQTVPPIESVTISTLIDRQLAQLDATPSLGPAAGQLARAIGSVRPLGNQPAPPSHGDFFPRNILRSQDGLSVVDWDCFGTALPLHDLFYLIFGAEFYAPGANLTMDLIVENAFYSDLPVQAFLRDTIAAFGVAQQDVHCYLLCYLAHMLCEHPSERKVWLRLCDRLAHRHFPAPWHSLAAA